MSGVASYRVDGLEEELSPGNIENLNENILNNYNLKTGQIVATNKESGKIVNNYECYIVVFLESEEAKSVEKR